jgi:hypothetical protein
VFSYCLQMLLHFWWYTATTVSIVVLSASATACCDWAADIVSTDPLHEHSSL